METIKTLIVDDSAMARRGIRTVLEKDAAFEVIGEAAVGWEALEKAAALMPDLVLMDVRMPGMNGIEATRRIKARLPYVTVVMLSVSNDVQDFFEAIRSGAQGYLLKDMQPDQWVEYLRGVMRGDAPVSPELAEQLLREFQKGRAQRTLDDGDEGMPLTDREFEVLGKVAEGLSNAEIAEALYISEPTVKNHLRNIMAKLHLRNRVELVSHAYRRGWLGGRGRP